jgi:hypothetical protein
MQTRNEPQHPHPALRDGSHQGGRTIAEHPQPAIGSQPRSNRPRPRRRPSIDWTQVGAEWHLELAVPPARQTKTADDGVPSGRRRLEISLVDPEGRHFNVMRVDGTRTDRLVAWSGDGRRALIESLGSGGKIVTEVDLEKAKAVHRISVGSLATVTYTRPLGLGVLVNDRGSVRWVDLDRVGDSCEAGEFRAVGVCDDQDSLHSFDGVAKSLGHDAPSKACHSGRRTVLGLLAHAGDADEWSR